MISDVLSTVTKLREVREACCQFLTLWAVVEMTTSGQLLDRIAEDADIAREHDYISQLLVYPARVLDDEPEGDLRNRRSVVPLGTGRLRLNDRS